MLVEQWGHSFERNEMRLISVVIPTAGVRPTLRRTVESVLTQTYGNIQCIVVVDGGPAPADLASDPRLKIVLLGRNYGAAVARNVGIACSRGDLIAFLDDDDFYPQERLAIAEREIGEADLHVMDLSEVEHRKIKGTGVALSGNISSQLARREAPQLGQVLIKREKTLFFDPDFRLVEDNEMWVRFGLRGAQAVWSAECGLVRTVSDDFRFEALNQLEDQRTRRSCQSRLIRKHFLRLLARPRALSAQLTRLAQLSDRCGMRTSAAIIAVTAAAIRPSRTSIGMVKNVVHRRD